MLSRNWLTSLPFAGRSTTSSPPREPRTVGCCPHYYGESGGKVGWYGYREGSFSRPARLGIFPETTIELYLWSLDPADLKRILPNPPDVARSRVDRVPAGNRPPIRSRRCSRSCRMPGEPPNVPAERRADMVRAPSRSSRSPTSRSARPILWLGRRAAEPGAVFRCRTRRAGLPKTSPRLVERIEPGSVTLTLVNTSGTAARRRSCRWARTASIRPRRLPPGDRTIPLNAPFFEVQLAPVRARHSWLVSNGW